MKTIKLTLVGLLIIGANTISAQQDPHFTQYFDNMLFVNPAYAGSNGMLNMTALHREQWIGFDGAPRSTTFSIHSPTSYESVGVGLTAVNDMAGPLRQSMVYGDFSYTLRFKNSKSKLAFGAKAGFNAINVNREVLTTTVENDPKLTQNTRNNINPNFGFGVYYHNPRFFVGLSVPKLIERAYDNLSSTNLERRHLFGIIGGIIDLNAEWKFRPTAQLKMTSGAPVSIDISAAGIYQDKIWIGAMYRWNAAAGAFFQFQLNPQFRVGLASDFGVTRINKYNTGTFEVMLSYDFSFKKDGVRSPRYF
jgi:type IX secretion system PorP/SprF family membrane protein